MQDEINEKVIALSIRTTKLTAEMLQKSIRFMLSQIKKQLDKPVQHHGKQTLINRWCNKGKVKYFSIRAMNMIPKIYLIDFFCSNAFRTIPRKSEWHISSLQNYRRWKYLDSLQSK